MKAVKDFQAALDNIYEYIRGSDGEPLAYEAMKAAVALVGALTGDSDANASDFGPPAGFLEGAPGVYVEETHGSGITGAETHTCAHCGEPLDSTRKRYCNDTCRQAAKRDRDRDKRDVNVTGVTATVTSVTE